MRSIEVVLIGLITAITVACAITHILYVQIACPLCARNTSTIAAWVTMMSSNITEVREYVLRSNASIPSQPNEYTAPVVVWVNATPVFYTMGWKP